MINYINVDENGFVLDVYSSVDEIENAIKGIIDFTEQPSEWHRFNINTNQWVDTKPVSAYEREAKNQRQILLQESDWTQLPDVPLETKTAWAQYRQELRDITTQEGYPFAIMWPAKPE